MTKEMKQYLETVVTSIVNEDADSAKEAFHEYLRLKTQEVLGEASSCSEDEEECDEECDEDEGSGSGEEGSGSGEEDEKKED